jgi:hypothetical protein
LVVFIVAAIGYFGDEPGTAVGFLIVVGWVILIMVLFNHNPLRAVEVFVAPTVMCLLIVLVFFPRIFPLRDLQDVAASFVGIVRSAPLLAPLVLVLLILPLLQADVWRIANQLSQTRIVGVLALTVVVLLIVVRSILGKKLPAVLEARAVELCKSPRRVGMTRKGVAPAVKWEDLSWPTELTDERLESYWPPDGGEYVPYLMASERRILLAPLTVRLALTTTVVGFGLMVYMYALACVTVSTNLADSWIKPVGTVHELHIWFVALPGDVYVRVAVLLGLVATAAFLSFAIIDDRLSTALREAWLEGPVDRFLVLAIPYVALDEKRLESSPTGAVPAADSPASVRSVETSTVFGAGNEGHASSPPRSV